MEVDVAEEVAAAAWEEEDLCFAEAMGDNGAAGGMPGMQMRMGMGLGTRKGNNEREKEEMGQHQK